MAKYKNIVQLEQLNQIKQLEDFDWNLYENGSVISKSSNEYDSISDYKHGIAIVTKYGKYGAIMVGDKVIAKPVYNALSEFDNGYAKATYLLKNNSEKTERIINMSGQICVKFAETDIFLPDEYEWGFDFRNNICVVIKDGKYGVIDRTFKVIHNCDYCAYEDFFNGYAVLKNGNEGIIIDEEGNVQYKIYKIYRDGDKIISNNDNASNTMYGMLNSKMELIIPIQYMLLQRLNNGFYIASSQKGTTVFIDPNNGDIILEKTITKIIDINKDFFVTYLINEREEVCESIIYNSSLSLVLSVMFEINVYHNLYRYEQGWVYFELNDIRYKCDIGGNLYVISKRIRSVVSKWDFRWEDVTSRKVCHDYINYYHSEFSQKYEMIEDTKHKKGLCDMEGNVVLLPQYNEIIPFSNELFIVASPCANGNTLVFGVVDRYNNIKVPFVFKCLLRINEKFLAYTDDEVYDITEDNKYYKLELPSFNRHYTNIKFGIIDLDGNKLTTADFSTIISLRDYDVFIIGKEFGKFSTLKYGVVNSAGCYILVPKYDKITYSEEANCFITNLSYSDSGDYPYETKSNHVSIYGFYLIQGDKDETVLVPTQIADWCDKFSEDGIALVIKDGHKGHINRFFQIVAFNEDERIVIPEKFDFSGDFKYGFASVSKNNRYGIINTKLEQILSCDYEYIEPLSAKRFKFKKDDQWGVVDSYGNIIINSKYRSISHEAEAVIKVETTIQNRSYTLYGLYNEDGNLIIPEECENIVAVEYETQVFLLVTINGKQGVYDDKGSKIIPLIYDRIDLKESYFMCHILESQSSCYSYQERKIKSTNKYNLKGEQLLTLNEKQIFVVPAEYDLAYPSVNGLIIVIKERKWGMINMLNDVIVEPQYCEIDFLDSFLACVGKYEEDCLQDSIYKVKNIKYGLIDTTGEVVLPLEYKCIKLWDNGYYYVEDGTRHQILTPSLKVAIDLQGKKCKKLDNRYIIVYSHNYYECFSLIDFHGNEIIPGNEYRSFFGVEVLDNGFLKVIFDKSEYNGDSDIGIIDQRGKEIYRNIKCKDISLVGNGYLLVKGFRFTSKDGSGLSVYNVANFQGKELFKCFFDEIRFLEDGNFSVRGDKGWGFSNRMGNLIASPRYENELEFDNGIADISIVGKDKTLKINLNGNIQVENNKESILLPNIYYWGTNFKYGVSIVRSIVRVGLSVRDYVGVVNFHGEEIVPTIYKSIKLLSDRTILCREDDCYGLYNTKGKCILPVIFSVINHVAKNRIRVVWNLEIAKSWDKDKYEKGGSDSKFQGSGTNYEVNQRAALCDSCGTILNDKQYLYVSNFTGKYAKVYNEIKVVKARLNYKTVLTQTGVIDLDGNTLVPPEYDRIFLYEHSFAKLRKGKIYGIVNLPSKKITMFESLQINRMWDLDEYGRCLYSTDWTYDKEDEVWKGTKGVLSFDGVIVPPKKYDRIILLKNGLIKVYKDNAIGLWDKHGNELLPPKYSYLSDFEGKYASICLGGTNDKDNPYDIIGGKWGMIDDGGNIVNEWVIVPPKKYDRIILLKNGLIKVYKDNAIGLLDKYGNELLPPKYSYLSDFEGKYASICLGGTKDEYYPYSIIGGKWGMIDDRGNMVNDCVNNEELVIPSTDHKPMVAENAIDNRKPTVLLSDYIPDEKRSYSDDYYYDNSDDDYDNRYSKYGGYNGYDDQTIDDAFGGDPSLTWNID